MTILYNTNNNLRVILKRQGSVWPKVLPFCILNVCLTIAVYYLFNIYGIDLTFSGGVGYRYISTLVSFFTIAQINSTYARFWEARGHLGTALTESNMLAARAALYTAHDDTDKADEWRVILKKHLLELVDICVVMIKDGRAGYQFNLMDKNGNEKANLERHGLAERKSLMTVVASVKDLEEEGKTVMSCAMNVDATILTAGKYVKDGCKNSGELLGHCEKIVQAYYNLIKFQTTPRPFIMAQMGRTLVFLWILTLPGAVVNTHKSELYEACWLVFIVTYGFIGLTLADIEMHDSLGDDPNDLEPKRYFNLMKADIESHLGKNSLSSDGKLLTNAYKNDDTAGYGSVV